LRLYISVLRDCIGNICCGFYIASDEAVIILEIA